MIESTGWEMAQRKKAPAPKLHQLNSAPEAPTVWGENWPLQGTLWPPHISLGRHAPLPQIYKHDKNKMLLDRWTCSTFYVNNLSEKHGNKHTQHQPSISGIESHRLQQNGHTHMYFTAEIYLLEFYLRSSHSKVRWYSSFSWGLDGFDIRVMFAWGEESFPFFPCKARTAYIT